MLIDRETHGKYNKAKIMMNGYELNESSMYRCNSLFNLNNLSAHEFSYIAISPWREWIYLYGVCILTLW